MAIYISKFKGQEVDEILDSVKNKQDKLTAGEGISIINGTIKMNFSLYNVVTSLPTSNIDRNKLYLVLSSNQETNNIYKEYLYTDNGWEKLGEFTTPDDLGIYATKTELQSLKTTVSNNSTNITSNKNSINSLTTEVNTIKNNYVTNNVLSNSINEVLSKTVNKDSYTMEDIQDIPDITP